MILFSVLAAVGACVVLTLLDAFYDSIIKWLSKIGEVAQRVVKGVLIGCKTFLSDVRKNIGKEISKNYSKVGEKMAGDRGFQRNSCGQDSGRDL